MRWTDRSKRTRRPGFTLIELMVVILIVAILAAVFVPAMHGRANRARWNEGMSGAGVVATALRAYCVEQERDLGNVDIPSMTTLGFRPPEMDGKFFQQANYSITTLSYTASTGVLTYTIQVTPGADCTGGPITLDNNGNWTGTNSL